MAAQTPQERALTGVGVGEDAADENLLRCGGVLDRFYFSTPLLHAPPPFSLSLSLYLARRFSRHSFSFITLICSNAYSAQTCAD